MLSRSGAGTLSLSSFATHTLCSLGLVTDLHAPPLGKRGSGYCGHLDELIYMKSVQSSPAELPVVPVCCSLLYVKDEKTGHETRAKPGFRRPHTMHLPSP